MQLDLTDEESAALLSLLNRVIADDRYPLSPRIRVLRAIRAKLPGAPQEPPPARPPTAEERTPRRAPRAGRPRRCDHAGGDRGASCKARPNTGCDRPRGTRDHLLDCGHQHSAELVVHRPLMEPWNAVVSAVAVGLVSGLLVLSAGTIGRLLSRVFPPSPKAFSVDAAIHNRSSNARCNLI